MTDPFAELARLEERVKKAESEIPLLRDKLRGAEDTLKLRDEDLRVFREKMVKYQELGEILREIGFTSNASAPSVSSGASGSQTIEVKDPSQIIEVADPQEPLHVSTTELRGQIAKLIQDGKIEETLVNAKAVRSLLIREFGSAAEPWDIDTVLKELKALTAPPFRLFTFSPKNYMFRLRTGSEKRVKE